MSQEHETPNVDISNLPFPNVPPAEQDTLIHAFWRRTSPIKDALCTDLAEIRKTRAKSIATATPDQVAGWVRSYAQKKLIRRFLPVIMLEGMREVARKTSEAIATLLADPAPDLVSGWNDVLQAFQTDHLSPAQQQLCLWGALSTPFEDNNEQARGFLCQRFEEMGRAAGPGAAPDATAGWKVAFLAGNGKGEPGVLDKHLFELLTAKADGAVPMAQQFIEATPQRHASESLAGAMDALEQKPARSHRGAWYWYGRLLARAQQSPDAAVLEVTEQAQEAGLTALFREAPYQRFGRTLAEPMVAALARQNILLLPRLFPPELWSAYAKELQQQVELEFEKVLWTRPESAEGFIKQMIPWPDVRKLATSRLHRFHEQFVDASKALEGLDSPQADFERELCEQEIKVAFLEEVEPDSSFGDFSFVLDHPKAMGHEHAYLHALFDLEEGDWFDAIRHLEGLLGTKLPVYLSRVHLNLWLATLLSKDRDSMDKLPEICAELHKNPEELATVSDETMTQVLTTMIACPQETAAVSELLYKHMPTALDDYLDFTPALQQHSALRRRLFDVVLNEADKIVQWSQLRKLVTISLRAKDTGFLLELLDVCEDAASAPNIQESFLALLDTIGEQDLPEPWSKGDCQNKRALLLYQMGRKNEAAALVIPMLQKLIGSGRRDLAKALLTEVVENGEGPLPQELVPYERMFTSNGHAGPTVKDPVAEFTREHPISVFYVGGDWERRHQEGVSARLGTAYPNVRLDYDFSAWDSSIDHILNRVTRYNIVVVSCFMRTNNGHRIRSRARDAGCVLVKSSGRGQESIYQVLATALRDFVSTRQGSPAANGNGKT